MRLSDRLARLEQRNGAASFDGYIEASCLLARRAAYKIGAAIAELAGLPWDEVDEPDQADERAAAAVRGTPDDIEEARGKVLRRLRGLSIPGLFSQCAQVYTGAPAHEPVRGEAMDEDTCAAFLALLTEAEIVALGWCWAFYARPDQLLPA